MKQAEEIKFVLPSRQTLNAWSKDGYMLNFKLLAEKVIEANEKGDVDLTSHNSVCLKFLKKITSAYSSCVRPS